VFSLLFTACSDPLAYTIVNSTDEALVTWGLHEPCDQLISYKDDYEPEQQVPPRQTLRYEDNWGVSDTKCVQVIDGDGQLAFAAPYEFERTDVIRSLEPSGVVIPERETLPRQPWIDGVRESFAEKPLQMTFLIVAGLVSLPVLAVYFFALLLVPKAVYLGLRCIYRGLRAAYIR
jgi:hypothetical protein